MKVESKLDRSKKKRKRFESFYPFSFFFVSTNLLVKKICSVPIHHLLSLEQLRNAPRVNLAGFITVS